MPSAGNIVSSSSVLEEMLFITYHLGLYLRNSFPMNLKML